MVLLAVEGAPALFRGVMLAEVMEVMLIGWLRSCWLAGSVTAARKGDGRFSEVVTAGEVVARAAGSRRRRRQGRQRWR